MDILALILTAVFIVIVGFVCYMGGYDRGEKDAKKPKDFTKTRECDSVLGDVLKKIDSTWNTIPMICKCIYFTLEHPNMSHMDSIMHTVNCMQELDNIKKWKKAYDKQHKLKEGGK